MNKSKFKALKQKLKSIFSFQYPQDIKIKIKIALFYYVGLVLIFAIFRFLLLIVYPDIFASLSLQDKFISFLYGAQFDMAIISILLGGFIGLMFLPYPKSPKLIKFCVITMSIVVLITLILLSADFVYFNAVKRHMTEDIILAWRDKDFIVSYVFSYYWWALLLIFAIVFFAIRFSAKFIDKKYAPKPFNVFKSIGILILVFLLISIARRQNFSGMPINLLDAYKLEKSAINIQLILNGMFTQYYYLKGTNDTKGVIVNNFSQKKAFENVQKLLLSKDEFFPDEKYPLMRRIKNAKFKNYNVVVILLEGVSPQYIDAWNELRGGGGYSAKYGVTPIMDTALKNGAAFINAFAVGPRTQFGLISTMVGLPIVPGTVLYYGFDLMTHFTLLAKDLSQKGYWSMYAQTSAKESINMTNAAKTILGFDEGYGLGDYPILLDYPSINYYKYSGREYETFDFAAKKASAAHKAGKPFYIYMLTEATHPPFHPSPKQFHKYPQKDDGIEGFLNNLYFTDYSIGHFMDIAKKEGFFDNTIFVILSDHVMPNDGTEDIKSRFNIPFMIYAPKILKRQVIDYTVSQADLLPTLYHLLSLDLPFTALGTNALDKDAAHFALISDGMNIALYQGNDFVSHNRVSLVDANIDKNSEKFKTMQDSVLSLDKAVTEAIKFDIWYKAD
ncbi:MAG: LTA synthase family protein [Endomicrobium sp.]|jgi:phosphoglycerol transferase MdoB-like AlkP superfamily enzyme|nr:LTA synthase family protein [Endomicrobium sp.]